MRATLEFSLPEDAMEHRAALAGVDALIALEQIDNRLRGILKHGEPTQAVADLAREVRGMIPAELLEVLE